MQTKQQANLPNKAEVDTFNGTARGNMAAALSRWRNKTQQKKHVHYFRLIGGVVAGDMPEQSEDKPGDNARCIAR
jgi:hypothetical protein